MASDRNLVPRSLVKRVILLFASFWAVLGCLSAIFVSRGTLEAMAINALTTPIPATVTRYVVASATLTQAPTTAPTVTPVPASASPRPSDTATIVVPPTPIPSPTRFYIIPAQPTPLPTPDLPPAAPFPTTCDGPGRMNILLIGIDGVNDNYYRAARSDTMIMLGVNFADKTANMLSIPRDLWVPLPGLGQVTADRINTAYHYGELFGVPGGGPAALSTVLSGTFGLRVDRYVVVNFDSFIQGIDAIGGIDINIPRPLHDDAYPLRDGTGTIVIDFPAGNVHMDGATALIYARIRHDSSDFTRMHRQQQVLFAARDKLLSPFTLPQLPGLVQVLMGAARTDLSLQDMALLGCLAPQVSTQSINSWVIDGNMVQDTRLSDGADVLMPNMDAIVPVLKQFNLGQ
jgi:polyisoprenyl-teichoic acid--peptidoglycan teichoic acid transferase